MTHTVLLRFPIGKTCRHTNINDEIRLGESSNYTLEEYIQDRASEGVSVNYRCGEYVEFSDGESGLYEEAQLPIFALCGLEGLANAVTKVVGRQILVVAVR
jgi:hypothetical protein